MYGEHIGQPEVTDVFDGSTDRATERMPREDSRQEGILHSVTGIRGSSGQLLQDSLPFGVEHALVKLWIPDGLGQQADDFEYMRVQHLYLKDHPVEPGDGIGLPAQPLDMLTE